MRNVLVICLLSLTLALNGQAVLSVDRTEIRIGDQVRATIRTDLGGGREWINAEAVWPDTVKGIEVVSGPVWDRTRPEATSATWSVAFFDTGWVRIPALPIVVNHNGQTDTSFTNDVPIKVIPVEPDSTGLAEIKEIYLEPFSLAYYKRYIPHVLVAILLIIGIIMWIRRRKAKKGEVEIKPVPLLPHEWASRALDELEAKRLWQSGEVKEHYTNLTGILREYLERRFGIHAMEQTSDEILEQLRLQELSQPLLTDTEELLSVADLIKFAKADPGMDIHAVTIGRVRAFVRETIPVISEPLADQPKTQGDEVVE